MGGRLWRERDAAEFALTFDDGPNDPWTGRLLDVLARHQARATFFLIGKYVRARPELVREIRDAGHLIGNHTMTHPWLAVRVRRGFGKNWRVAMRRWRTCWARRCDSFGRRMDRGVRSGARGAGTGAVGSDVERDGIRLARKRNGGRDCGASGARDRAESARGRGSNLLLHDGGHVAMGADRSQSVEATRRILERHGVGKVRYVTVDAWA